MDRKLKSTLGLIGLLVFIVIAGGSYIFIFQNGKIKEKKNKLEELKANDYNTDQLNMQLKDMIDRSSVLDSVLAARKFNIPQNLSSIKFYNFVNLVSTPYSNLSQVDVEYIDQKQDGEFYYHEYKLKGKATYNDLYNLVYSIEQSKELKKVKSISLSNLIANDKNGNPSFLVGFEMVVGVYFSTNDRFATSRVAENNLNTGSVYDAFYPLIRNEIQPNYDELLDVQGAKLLALVPEGAFVSDTKGNTYLLWEGEQVYLGYLTKIDYEKNKVSFILNKGGIIEKVDLQLEKENIKKN